MRAVKKVTISYDLKSGWVVSPASLRLERGEEAVFRIKGGRAVVFIPWPQLFEDCVTEDDEDYSPPGEVRKSGRGIVLRVSEGKMSKVMARRAKRVSGPKGKKLARLSAAELVTLPYAVYCEGAEDIQKAGDFAQGNSTPVMIIDPPENGGNPANRFGRTPRQ